VIMRMWRARAAMDKSQLYPTHFAEVVLPRLRQIPGFLGAYLLRREAGGEVEFVVATQWATHEAIARFAGPDPTAAVVDADAEAMLSTFDAAVSHHDVLLSPAEHSSRAS